jgi:transposase
LPLFEKGLIHKTPISCKTIGDILGLDGKQLQTQYYAPLSNFTSWKQGEHASEWILFPANIASDLSMDETSLSQGELYTIVTNKAAKGNMQRELSLPL